MEYPQNLCAAQNEHKRDSLVRYLTYGTLVLILIQSLKEQAETKEEAMQKTADTGGCVIPLETTQPSATYPLGASGNQME